MADPRELGTHQHVPVALFKSCCPNKINAILAICDAIANPKRPIALQKQLKINSAALETRGCCFVWGVTKKRLAKLR